MQGTIQKVEERQTKNDIPFLRMEIGNESYQWFKPEFHPNEGDVVEIEYESKQVGDRVYRNITSLTRLSIGTPSESSSRKPASSGGEGSNRNAAFAVSYALEHLSWTYDPIPLAWLPDVIEALTAACEGDVHLLRELVEQLPSRGTTQDRENESMPSPF